MTQQRGRERKGRVRAARLRGAQAIVKRHPDEASCRREARALNAAAALLEPARLAVPRLLAARGRVLALEWVGGRPPDLAVPQERRAALAYLAALHAIRPPPGLPNHFHGRNLANRVRAEMGHFREARAACPALRSLLPAVRALARRAFDSARDGTPPVAAHGDFQPKNLRLNGDLFVPLDWESFGLAHPGYDLLCLLFDLDPGTALAGIREYRALRAGARDGAVQTEAALRRGAAPAALARIGAHFRAIAGAGPSGAARLLADQAAWAAAHAEEIETHLQKSE